MSVTSNGPAQHNAPVTPRPSAAVVLLRATTAASEGVEVFMVRRHIRSEFVPDAFVFPGGSVQPSDADDERAPGVCAAASTLPDDATALGSGYRVAALRECFEEAGVLLAHRGAAPLRIPADAVARFSAYRDRLNENLLTLGQLAAQEGLTLATDALLHWAHWVTPTAFPKRFTTHFFLAPMPDGQEAAHDALETTAGVWISPEAALAQYEQGTFPLVFATIHQLRALTGLADIVAARARFGGKTPPTIMPHVVQRDGEDVILMPDEEG